MVHVKRDRWIMGGRGQPGEALRSFTSLEFPTQHSPARSPLSRLFLYFAFAKSPTLRDSNASSLSRTLNVLPFFLTPPSFDARVFFSRFFFFSFSFLFSFLRSSNDKSRETKQNCRSRVYRDRWGERKLPAAAGRKVSGAKVTFPIITLRDMVISNEQDFN